MWKLPPIQDLRDSSLALFSWFFYTHKPSKSCSPTGTFATWFRFFRNKQDPCYLGMKFLSSPLTKEYSMLGRTLNRNTLSPSPSTTSAKLTAGYVRPISTDSCTRHSVALPCVLKIHFHQTVELSRVIMRANQMDRTVRSFETRPLHLNVRDNYKISACIVTYSY